MTRKTLATLAATLALALPMAASAADDGDIVVLNQATGEQTRKIAVALNDLNLSTTEGRKTADQRVNRAARMVCAWATGTVLPEEKFRACFTAAVKEGRDQMIRTAEVQRKERVAG
jgi:UrcA family protein